MKHILVERHTIIHTDATMYRLRPNPDSEGGFHNGAALEWSEDGGKTWTGYFFIAPEAMGAIGVALAEAGEAIDVREIGR